jgi:ATP-dependent helicase/nuclease subunit A
MVLERMERGMNAADPRTSAWVAANAGAGKTYTLANRVTRLLLAGARPERILCLTYTKAAAAEMAGRLFDRLGQWSMLSDSALAEKIAETGADPGNKEDLKEARRLFAKALETPGGLKIQTIHAFCQYVLTRFPLEAGVPAAFDVLDDRTGADLMAAARARVFEKAGSSDGTLQAAVAHLVTHVSDDRLDAILRCALGADRGKIDAFVTQAGGPENDWSAILNTAHGAKPGDTTGSIAAEFCSGLAHDKKTLQAVIAWLATGTKTDVARSADLAAAWEADSDTARFDGIAGAVLTGTGTIRKSLATKKLADAKPDLLDWLQRVAETVLDTTGRLNAVKAALLAEAALIVIHEVREIYAAEKRARNLLDYDDLIVTTHRLLHTHGAAWVLFKLDEGIDHVLIDEAQDTSGLQWDIIQKLTEEFFAGEGAARVERTLFAVGDEKQSIFSFQGADPTQFDRRRKFFERRAQEGQREFLSQPLTDSWRSAAEVLAFVDETFAHAEARDGLTSSEAPIHHNALKKNLKGCVEFWPPLAVEDEADHDPWDLRPVDLPRPSSPVVRLASQIATRIKTWLDTKAALPGHDQPIQPGDIMILLPRREPFGSEIIRALKDRGVAVAGADRIVLTEQIAVMDLIALGRFALLPEDDLNLACLLRSPLIGLSETQLYDLAQPRNGTLWQELSARQSEFPEAYALLSEARARADFLPPFEYFASALTDGRKKLLKRLGSEANDAIDEFLALALQFEQSNTPSLEGFLYWAGSGGAEVKRDMERGRNEVRVMTVHGAKGLEADIVILPDTTRLPNNATANGQLLYTDAGVLFPVADSIAPEPVLAAKAAANDAVQKEYRRLLYVALTRAKERLIICGFENKTGTKDGSWHRLAARAAEALGRPREDGVRIFGDDALSQIGKTPSQIGETAVLPSWATTPAPEEHTAPRLIRPSEAAGSDAPAPASPLVGESPKRRGLLVHALLARLPSIAEPEREAVARRFLKARQVEDNEAEQLIGQTLAVIADPAVADAFGPGSRAEVSLVADLPELGRNARVHGRIDRLCIRDDFVLIVDFKTGRPVAQESDVPRLYAAQMALYRAAAAKIFPGRRIACALVWTEGPRVLTLSDATLEAETRRIRSRLDPGTPHT